MSQQGSRQKQDAGLGRNPGGKASTSQNPGRRSLGGELEQGDGLPYKQRSLFEASLGRDLSDVRVHTNSEEAGDLNARAMARGSRIDFAPGQYNPGTPEGDALLAHEVAHVAQQSGAQDPGGAVGMTSPGDSVEKNADSAVGNMLAGRPASVAASPVSIARKTFDEPIEAPAAGPAAEAPAGEAPSGDGAVPGTEAKSEEAEGDAGDLSVEPAGLETLEGEDQAVGPPQNLEGGKAELAAAGAALGGKAGGEGGGKAGGEGPSSGPQVEAAGPSNEGGEIALTPELQESLSSAKSETDETVGQAKAEATAWEGEVKAERERFDAEQTALTLEQLKSMSPADKRSTLIEMGYDQKAVKKMKDAELDGIISGKLEGERRKTKILGMTEEELDALSPSEKMQFLVDLGVDRKDLEKIGPDKAARAFDDVVRLAKVPGQHKVKIKIKGGLLGKSWEVKVNVDGEGNASFDAQKKGGFLSKLWNWVKLALPIILTLLAPVTGGVSLIVLAVYQAATAIARGDWMGALIGVAGAFVAVGALKAFAENTSAVVKALKQVGDIAGKVQKTAEAAKAAMDAAKAKSPGSLLAALANGASAFAAKTGQKASAFQQKMEGWSQRLEKWSKVVKGGETVAKGVKAKDPGLAISGAFDAAAAYVSKPGQKEAGAKQKDFQRYSRMASFASAGQAAAKANPPNYGAIVDAAMGLATELKTKDGKSPRALEDARKIVSSANALSSAIISKDPNAIAEAALGLAETIHTAKYDEPEEPGKKDSDGDGVSDDREKVLSRYAKAGAIITFAGAAMEAAAKKPRPDYMSALTAGTQLIADLTESRKIDQAAHIQGRLDAWTRAVQSKNEKAIEEAGIAFGESINGMRDILLEERAEAKKAAEAKAAPGEQIAEPDSTLPSYDFTSRAIETFKPTLLESPPAVGADDLIPATHSKELVELATPVEGGLPNPVLDPRSSTPNANYTVFKGDSLSRIAVAFKISVAELRALNPQLGAILYEGQRLFVPGADKLLKTGVSTSESYAVDADVAAEADRAQVARNGYRWLDLMRIEIRDWRARRTLGGLSGLGPTFLRKVNDFERRLNFLEQLYDDPSVPVPVLRMEENGVRALKAQVQAELDRIMGRADRVLEQAVNVATLVRDSAGFVINVLDRSRLVATGYDMVINIIDGYAKGDSAKMIAVNAAAGAALGAVDHLPFGLDKASFATRYIGETVKAAFLEAGKAANSFALEVARRPNMTAAEKSKLQSDTLKALVGAVAVSPVNAAIETYIPAGQEINYTDLIKVKDHMHHFEQAAMQAGLDAFVKATDVIVKSPQK